MSLRRFVTAASTFIVVVLALGVPFTQLQVTPDEQTCCCPDPATCKCGDHDKQQSSQPRLKACHKKPLQAIEAQLAAFLAPVPPCVTAPDRLARHVPFTIASPHPAPSARPPDAPS